MLPRTTPKAMDKVSEPFRPFSDFFELLLVNFPASWEEKLPLLQFAINDVYCYSTKSTPFRILFGKDPMPPVLALRENLRAGDPREADEGSRNGYVAQKHQDFQDVWEFVRQHQKEVAARMKAQEDCHRRDYQCQSGDLVLVSYRLHSGLRTSRK